MYSLTTRLTFTLAAVTTYCQSMFFVYMSGDDEKVSATTSMWCLTRIEPFAAPNTR